MATTQLAPSSQTACKSCRELVPNQLDKCHVCGEYAGAPNVRAASDISQVQALAIRVQLAVADSRSRNCQSVLSDFYDVTKQSVAIINMDSVRLTNLVTGENSIHHSFYKYVDAGLRLPEENKWDLNRRSADSMLFPHYETEIVFASLSLTDKGLTGYGDYSVTLKTDAIKKRASVFEENTMLFVQHHRIVPMDPIPLGYRAPWENRGDIAIAKLYKQINSQTTQSDFATIIQGGTSTTADMIEVHIYGGIHKKAIQSISAPQMTRQADKILQKSLLRKVTSSGIPISVV